MAKLRKNEGRAKEKRVFLLLFCVKDSKLVSLGSSKNFAILMAKLRKILVKKKVIIKIVYESPAVFSQIALFAQFYKVFHSKSHFIQYYFVSLYTIRPMLAITKNDMEIQHYTALTPEPLTKIVEGWAKIL